MFLQVLHRVLQWVSHCLFLEGRFWKIGKARFDQIQTECYPKLKGNTTILLPASNLTIMKLFLGLEKGKPSSSLKGSYLFTFVLYILLIIEEKNVVTVHESFLLYCGLERIILFLLRDKHGMFEL